MKQLASLLLLLSSSFAFSQAPTPESLGFMHKKLVYRKDSVDVLIYSKKGEESKPKPLFFFCQGSMPQPLIKYSDEGAYGVFPFSPDELAENYHVVIAGKPGVPLAAHEDELASNFVYVDSTTYYQQHNYLDYYVKRNLSLIRQLRKEKWASDKELVVAGHSEGSTIALNMAASSKKVTALIYSGGNPAGRIVSMLYEEQSREKSGDPEQEELTAYWKEIVENKSLDTASQSDPFKTTYSFSQPLSDKFYSLKIPVYVTYGTKDWCAPYILELQINAISKSRNTIFFHAYPGCEHNYFPLLADGTTDYSQFRWDEVAADWNLWLSKK